MSDASVGTPTEGSGPRIDCEQLLIGGQQVERQRVQESYPAIISASLTRPANVTAYTANTAVTTSTSAPVGLTIAGAARFNGGGGEIVAATLLDSSNVATKPDLELWIFAGAAPPTPDNDDAVFTPTDAELANLVGIIKFLTGTAWVVGDATAGANGNAIAQGTVLGNTFFRMPFRCGAATTSLWGMFVIRNAYVPTSAEIFTVLLAIKQE